MEFCVKQVQQQEVVYRLVGVKVAVREGGWAVVGSSWWGVNAIANLWVTLALHALASVGASTRMEPMGVQSVVLTAGGFTFGDDQRLAVVLLLFPLVVYFIHLAVGH
jgi:hypothetical protein